MQEHNKQNNSTKDFVLDKIKEGKISMKPKARFVAQTLLLGLGLSVLLLFSVYIVSFITFSLRISGMVFLPGLGFMGLRILFGALPWILILLSVLLIILLEFFSGKIAFVYKRPAIYSLAVIIAIVLLAGIVIGFSQFHVKIFHATPFYQELGAPKFKGFHTGIVLEKTEDGFIMKTPREEELNVFVKIKTRKQVEIGDMVLVVGKRQGDTIQAQDFRKIKQDRNFFEKPMPKVKGFKFER